MVSKFRAVQVIEDENNQFHVRLVAHNHEIVLTTEQYVDISWANTIADELGEALNIDIEYCHGKSTARAVAAPNDIDVTGDDEFGV